MNPKLIQSSKHGVAAEAARCAVPGALLAAEDPLAAMQRLATAWRRALDVQVIGVTGSTGKTSTKDLLLAVLAPQRRTVASRANFNTEIGVPLEILYDRGPTPVRAAVLKAARTLYFKRTFVVINRGVAAWRAANLPVAWPLS